MREICTAHAQGLLFRFRYGYCFCIHKKRISPVEPDLRIRHPIFGKMLVAGAICGMTAVGLAWTFRFSGDYLPAMWSDMDSFPADCRKTGNVQRTSALLVVPGDARFFSDLKNTILLTGLTVLAEMIFVSSGSPKQMESRKDGRES